MFLQYLAKLWRSFIGLFRKKGEPIVFSTSVNTLGYVYRPAQESFLSIPSDRSPLLPRFGEPFRTNVIQQNALFTGPIDPFTAPMAVPFTSPFDPITAPMAHLSYFAKPFSPVPLFPESGAISIKQGGTGDCYLLASLSAILKHPAGRLHIESMFQTLADGTVIVKIKSNAFSPHLLKKVSRGFLEGKYEFKQERGYDIFKIAPERLAEIQGTAKVESNAVAVQILERLSSYYHSADWGRMPELMPGMYADPVSLLAHDMYRIHEPRFDEANAPGFVAAILGIDARAVKLNDAGGLDFLRQLKYWDPTYPVYLEMLNTSGSGAHAYQLDRIELVPPSNYCRVFLIDPYDNTKVSQYTLDELKWRNPKCFVYDVPAKVPAVAHIWNSTTAFNIYSKVPDASTIWKAALFSGEKAEAKSPESLLHAKLHEIIANPAMLRGLIEKLPAPQRSQVATLIETLRRNPELIDAELAKLMRKGFFSEILPSIPPADSESFLNFHK